MSTLFSSLTLTPLTFGPKSSILYEGLSQSKPSVCVLSTGGSLITQSAIGWCGGGLSSIFSIEEHNFGIPRSQTWTEIDLGNG